jgi:hypothetical protein
LIAALLQERDDCHFVVMTHDLELAAAPEHGDVQAVLLAGCTWAGETVTSWDAHLVDPERQLPEEARRAVLGGRRKVLFVEGEAASLDAGLYALLFPDHSLNPLGSCEQVIRSVTGLRSSAEHHWVEASGIVDADGRSDDEIVTLGAKGILVLRVHEVEHAYYCEPVLRAVAVKVGALHGRDPDELVLGAKKAGLKTLERSDVLPRLVGAVARQALQRLVLTHLPPTEDLVTAGEAISITASSPYPSRLAEAQAALTAEDWATILRVIPLRESAFRAAVSRALNFSSYGDYEAAVRVALLEDASEQ